MVEIGDLFSKCSDICADMDTLHLVLQMLVKGKRAVVIQTDRNEKVMRRMVENVPFPFVVVFLLNSLKIT